MSSKEISAQAHIKSPNIKSVEHVTILCLKFFEFERGRNGFERGQNDLERGRHFFERERHFLNADGRLLSTF